MLGGFFPTAQADRSKIYKNFQPSLRFLFSESPGTISTKDFTIALNFKCFGQLKMWIFFKAAPKEA